MKLRIVSAMVLGLGLCGAVLAEEKPKKVDLDAQFKRLDKDSDGKLTLEEFTGKRDAEKAKTAFTKLDKDQDNSLSLEEFKSRGKKKGT